VNNVVVCRPQDQSWEAAAREAGASHFAASLAALRPITAWLKWQLSDAAPGAGQCANRFGGSPPLPTRNPHRRIRNADG
jgi:hypothetical protein